MPQLRSRALRLPETLSEVVDGLAGKFGVPGVAVGVWSGGRESYTAHGVTSIENPLPVDERTLFILGSVTKSFTASALMVLVERGEVDLGAPVRRYLPEFTLPDEKAAARSRCCSCSTTPRAWIGG